MQKSETIGELAKALAQAQGVIQGAKKDSENPFFKSKYADLASVWEACRGPLSGNGLAVIQTTEPEDEHGAIPVETLLAHSSGEWVCGKLRVRPVKDDPQAMGSAITYARRYALAAMVGVAPEDDDANAASHSNGHIKPAAAKAKPSAAVNEDVERQVLFGTIKDAGGVLNKLKDSIKWDLKSANEFANDNFNTKGGVQSLTIPQLRELAALLASRIDTLKEPKVPPVSELMKSVLTNFDSEKHFNTYLAEHKYPEASKLTQEQLLTIEADVSIPF